MGMQSISVLLSVLVAVAIQGADRNGDSTAKVPIRELGEGRLQVGAVRLDTKARSLTFPAVINMTTGLVEYVIVTTKGKVHESLLRSDAEPYHIHTAMLLLGVKPSTNIDTSAFFNSKRQIPGAKIRVELIQEAGGTTKALPIEMFLAYAQTKKAVKAGDITHWVYNGSYTSDGTFLAQRDGSIVSLIADPAALINNPRSDRENDELWTLHTPLIPPLDTPVQVKFSLLE